MIYEDIKFKDYPVIDPWYGGKTTPGTLSLPEDMKLVACDKNDIGRILCKDCLHYIGCYDKYILDDDRFHSGGHYYEIGDKVFIIFENLHFVDEKPELMSGEEFQKEFFGPNFLIFTWSEQNELVSVTKLLKFTTPYQVECVCLNIPVESLNVTDALFSHHKRYSLEYLLHDYTTNKRRDTFAFNNSKANVVWDQLLEKYVGFSRIGSTLPVEFDESEPSRLLKESENLITNILNEDYQGEEEEKAKNQLKSISSRMDKIMNFED